MAFAEQVNALTDDAVRRLRSDLLTIIGRLRQVLAARLQDAHRDADGRLVSDDWNAELAAKLEASFSSMLKAIGYDDAVNRLRVSFDQVQEASDTWISDRLGGSMATAAERSVIALVDGTVESLLLRKDEAGNRLREVMVLGAHTNAQLDDVLEGLAEAAGIELRQAIVEADTQLMGLHRNSTAVEAQAAGIDLYTYEGPDDGITRPFCAPMVGKITTLEDLDKMDPGDSQPRPVSRFLGGYRCRHSLAPISLEEAQAMVDEDGASAIAPESPLARAILLRGREGPAAKALRVRLGKLQRATG